MSLTFAIQYQCRVHDLVAMFIDIALLSTLVLYKRFYFNLYVPCTYLAFCYIENMCEICLYKNIYPSIYSNLFDC